MISNNIQASELIQVLNGMYGRADWNKIRHKFNFGIVPGYFLLIIKSTFISFQRLLQLLSELCYIIFQVDWTAEKNQSFNMT